MDAKATLRAILESEKLIPRVRPSSCVMSMLTSQELIFLGRCQRMLQANNQMLGSPSSRVNITAQWAARGYADSLTGSRALSAVGLRVWLKDRVQKLIFQFTLWFIDVAFWWTKLQQREYKTHCHC
jgi:aarF domain-containing kinase